MSATTALLQKLAADQETREQERADADAAKARAELAAFDRHPPTIRKAQATVEAMKAKVARAEADLAVAKANYVEAWAEENRLSQRWSYDLNALRMRARNLPRLLPARDRLSDYLENLRRSADFPVRKPHDLLVEAMHTLGGMQSGSVDPIADYEAFVDDAIARAEDAIALARQEHRKQQERAEQAKRAQKLLS